MPSIFHIPTLFPEVLFLSFYAPIFLRIGVSILFLDETRCLLKNSTSRSFAVVPAIIGLSIVSGFLTQAAAIAGIIYVIGIGKFLTIQSIFKNNLIILLSITIFFSLFFTGPGAVAFDLPY